VVAGGPLENPGDSFPPTWLSERPRASSAQRRGAGAHEREGEKNEVRTGRKTDQRTQCPVFMTYEAIDPSLFDGRLIFLRTTVF
jgi:hypothetical protein